MARSNSHDISGGKALFVGTLTGWAGVLLIDILSFPFIWNEPGISGFLATALVLTIYYTLFGLPVAMVICFAIGLPLWLALKTWGEITTKSAVGLGFLVGGILGMISFSFFQQSGISLWWLTLDWLSTIAVGGFAGWVGYKHAAKDIEPEDLRCFT